MALRAGAEGTRIRALAMGGFPTRMPLGMHFEVLGSGKAPTICFVLHPKGILVANPPWPGLWPRRRFGLGGPSTPVTWFPLGSHLQRGTRGIRRL